MARISLHADEATARHLPELCMVCGRPSRSAPTIRIPWSPLKQAAMYAIPAFVCAGCGGVPFWFLIAFGMRKTMPVEVPLCERHLSYFAIRGAIYWSVAVLSVAVPLLAALVVLLIVPDAEPQLVVMLFVYGLL